MKLINQVLKIRSLVQQAIDNRFAKMGIKETGLVPVESLPQDLIPKRQKLEDILNNHLSELQDYSKARQETINECTFTLFNKIAAIKVMEEKELFPEVIKRRPENGNKSFAHNLWLEENPGEKSAERQGLKHFLQAKFNELGENFSLYNENYPYSLMPTADELYNILEAFNEVEDDPECGADVWKGDDILGWLYEDFNATEKEVLKNSDEKTEYDKVSLQSQVYTPRWVVKFLVDNTLGKMYLEMFPDSDIVKPDENGELKYKIANAPASRKRDIKKMEEIRVIDPACGSGNFLIYTFDLLYDMYVNQIEQYGAEYSRRDIPRLILENNIYGVDLDERAVQLSQIALFIKAREKGGRRAKMPSRTNVVSTHFFLPNYSEVESEFISSGEWDSKQRETIKKIWSDLQNAYKFGTLVRVEEVLNGLSLNDKEGLLFAEEVSENLFSFKRRVTEVLRDQVKAYCEKNASEYALTKADDAMTFLSILSMPFDVVVANPPYTDSGDFGPELKEFTEENYKKPYKAHTNLYASFIKRCCELAGKNGKVGMIHPHTFMYIKSFEGIRTFLLTKTHINVLVDYGLDRVNLFGPGILLDATFYTLDLSEKDTAPGVYFNITSNQQERYKKGSLEQALCDYLEHRTNERVFELAQEKLKGIKSFPFIYWISDEFRKIFAEYPLQNEARVISGFKTGNNEGALRFWWEVNSSFWVKYTKGGVYNRWYGNNWLKINSCNDFEYIKNQNSYNIPSVLFTEGITYNGSGSKGVTFRLLEDDTLFDMGACALFPSDTYFSLGLLNSKLLAYSTDCLNPTVNVQPGDIHRLPFVNLNTVEKNKSDVIRRLARQNVAIKKRICEYSIIEPLFSKSPLLFENNDILSSLFAFYTYENALHTIVILNEGLINLKVFELYGVSNRDKQMVFLKEGGILSDITVSRDAKRVFVEWLSANDEFVPEKEVLEYIDGIPEQDGCDSITDFESLYLNNNNWEEFCIKHRINPIDAWYQFKRAKVLPSQRSRDLAFELLTDLIRSVLRSDDDGIVPINEKLGEETLEQRIEKEFHDRGCTAGQYSQFTKLLGGDIHNYLISSYFQQLSDYLNLFMYLPKTPFIWHITSGPLHTLDLFTSIYRWDRNTLFRIKSVYAANRETALKERLNSLSSSNAIDQMEINTINDQLKELKSFVSLVDSLLSSGYNPILDSGVAKNIAPLQRLGIISYDVLNRSQLKRYLNATW